MSNIHGKSKQTIQIELLPLDSDPHGCSSHSHASTTMTNIKNINRGRSYICGAFLGQGFTGPARFPREERSICTDPRDVIWRRNVPAGMVRKFLSDGEGQYGIEPHRTLNLVQNVWMFAGVRSLDDLMFAFSSWSAASRPRPKSSACCRIGGTVGPLQKSCCTTASSPGVTTGSGMAGARSKLSLVSSSLCA